MSTYTAINLVSRPEPGPISPDLFEVVQNGAVRIEVNQTYPLAEAARAHQDLEARKTTGSTILIPGE